MECLIINYNRRIKLKLSKFLYGKNRCKITWPMLFILLKMRKMIHKIKLINYKIKQKKKNINISSSNYKNNIELDLDIYLKIQFLLC